MSEDKPLEAAASPEGSPLTVEQWQGLSRLADLIRALETGLHSELGDAVAKNLTVLSQAIEGDFPESLRRATETLTILYNSGVVDQLEMVLKTASQVPEFWQEVVPLRLAEWSKQLGDIDVSGLVELTADSSRAKALRSMMSFLRYVSDGEESSEFLGQVTEFVNRTSVLAKPELLKILPIYVDLLVQMERSGILGRIMDLLAYFGSLTAALDPSQIIGAVLDYLHTTDLVDQVRQIHPGNLARVAAAASDPKVSDVMSKGLKALGMLSQTDMMNDLLDQGLRISGVMLEPDFLETMPELLDIAVLLHKSGMLEGIRQLMIAYPQLSHLPWDDYISNVLDVVDGVDVSMVGTKIQDALEETRQQSAHLGGVRGMMYLMRQKKVQVMLQLAVSLGTRLLPLDERKQA